MSLHRFEVVQRVPIPRSDASAFFSDPRNLAVITPPDMGFEISSDLPERIHPGLIVTYRVRPLARVPVTWVTEISHVVGGELFVDDQRLGPYRFWHHQHHFADVPGGAGGTEMRDIVHYALPFRAPRRGARSPPRGAAPARDLRVPPRRPRTALRAAGTDRAAGLSPQPESAAASTSSACRSSIACHARARRVAPATGVRVDPVLGGVVAVAAA